MFLAVVRQSGEAELRAEDKYTVIKSLDQRKPVVVKDE